MRILSEFLPRNPLLSSLQLSSDYLPILLIIAALGLSFLISKRRSRIVELIGRLPGPPGLPVLGNTIEINVEHDGEWNTL